MRGNESALPPAEICLDGGRRRLQLERIPLGMLFNKRSQVSRSTEYLYAADPRPIWERP